MKDYVIPDETPLQDIVISTRSMHCLTSNGFKTVGDVRRADDRELLRLPNFGRVSFDEVRKACGREKDQTAIDLSQRVACLEADLDRLRIEVRTLERVIKA